MSKHAGIELASRNHTVPVTQQQIDKRVVELVKRQHDLAKKLLEEHMDKLDELAGEPSPSLESEAC